MDVSLTFMRSKGILPLLHAAPGASRVVLAACPEGAGHHGLFPFVNLPRAQRVRQIARRVIVQPRAAPQLAAAGAAARVRPRPRPRPGSSARAPAAHPIHLYPPGLAPGVLPREIPGMRPVYSWDDVVARVTAEQHGRTDLEAVVYPCAPLQVLEGREAPA
jgi:hypothetical protein